MNLKKFFSFIIPIKNQEKFIQQNLDKLIALINKLKCIANFEIILIDDYSTDNTFSIIKNLSLKNNKIKIYRNKSNMGKGFSIKKGVSLLNKKTNKFIILDSDIPYIEKIPQLVTKLIYNKCVIINRKTKKSKLIIKKKSFYIYYRLLIGHLFNFIFRLIGLTNIKDTQAGLKGFDIQLKNYFNKIKTNGFLFDIEILYILKKKNYLPISVPCKYYISTDSSIKFNLRIYLKIIRDLIIIIYNFLKKNYD